MVSELTDYVKKHFSSQYPPQLWIKLCDLGVLVGYPKREDRIFKQDISKWLCVPVPKVEITQNFIKDTFNDIFGLKWSDANNFASVSFYDFLFSRWRWMNSGACKYSTLEINGKRVRTKRGVALSLSDKQLLNLQSFNSIKKEGLRAFVKMDEKGIKGRYVVNAPFGLFLHLKYMLDRFLVDHPNLSNKLVFYTKKKTHVKTIQSSLRDFENHIPVDFSAFDTKVSFIFYYAFCDIIRSRYCDDSDILRSINIFYQCLGVLPVFDADGKKIGLWRNGLPSGLYITAFFGSLVNLTCQYYVEKVSFGLYKAGFGAGDDGDLISTCVPDLHYLSSIYSQTGQEVNVQKNWFTSNITEFLKMIITPTQVFQYPARAFASIAWAYPGSFDSTTIYSKMFTMASVWKEFFDRIGFSDENLMALDIQRSIRNKLPKWSKDMVLKWLHVAPALGGFGLVPVDRNFRIKIKSKRSQVTALNLRYKLYPLISDFVIDVKLLEIQPYKLVNSLISDVTLWSVFKRNNISFDEYIQFLRHVYSLPNILIVNNSVVGGGDTTLPFRQFGVSDVYVKSTYGPIHFKGITSDYLILLTQLRTVYQLESWNKFSFLLK